MTTALQNHIYRTCGALRPFVSSVNSYVTKRQLSFGDFKSEKAFINGEWCNSMSGSRFDVTNPVDNKIVSSVANCDVNDTARAVTAAKDAFQTWQFTTAKERHDVLMKWFNLMMDNKDDLAKLMTIEQGKPLAEAVGEINYAAAFFEWFAEEARRINGEIVPPSVPGRQILMYREPIGVAALITPWNFPAAMITRKAGAALASGCTCVVKPAEDTPLSALALCVKNGVNHAKVVFQLAEEAGLPKGVFNVVPCSRENAPSVGEFLCRSDDVATVSFTGSTAVGKKLLLHSADSVKRVSLELGGNAPFIVFDSADITRAIDGALASRFRNSGQTCVCADRFFVQSGIYDQFVAKLSEAVKSIKLANGLDPTCKQGPLINNAAVEKVSALVEDAKSKGAKVVCGGETAPEIGQHFYKPTILTDVHPDMPVFKNEIFGPVIPIMKFTSEEEAISLANNTKAGLAGYFFSQDVKQIFRVARRLETGMIGVNEGILSAPEAAFGGVKESGIGREGSHYGIDEYTNVKYVCLGGL